MTLEEAARLVLHAMPLIRGGEIFITKMPVVSVLDLARVLIRLVAPLYGRDPAAVKIAEIGPRPGEKIWEELNTDEEVRRTYDLGAYLVVLPALRNFYAEVSYAYEDMHLRPVERIYHSANEAPMTAGQIEDFLLKPGVLPAAVYRRLTGAEAGSGAAGSAMEQAE
jgi:FlaA1/EpsC-like NDP-sugar epimerase